MPPILRTFIDVAIETPRQYFAPLVTVFKAIKSLLELVCTKQARMRAPKVQDKARHD